MVYDVIFKATLSRFSHPRNNVLLHWEIVVKDISMHRMYAPIEQEWEGKNMIFIVKSQQHPLLPSLPGAFLFLLHPKLSYPGCYMF